MSRTKTTHKIFLLILALICQNLAQEEQNTSEVLNKTIIEKDNEFCLSNFAESSKNISHGYEREKIITRGPDTSPIITYYLQDSPQSYISGKILEVAPALLTLILTILGYCGCLLTFCIKLAIPGKPHETQTETAKRIVLKKQKELIDGKITEEEFEEIILEEKFKESEAAEKPKEIKSLEMKLVLITKIALIILFLAALVGSHYFLTTGISSYTKIACMLSHFTHTFLYGGELPGGQKWLGTEVISSKANSSLGYFENTTISNHKTPYEDYISKIDTLLDNLNEFEARAASAEYKSPSNSSTTNKLPALVALGDTERFGSDTTGVLGQFALSVHEYHTQLKEQLEVLTSSGNPSHQVTYNSKTAKDTKVYLGIKELGTYFQNFTTEFESVYVDVAESFFHRVKTYHELGGQILLFVLWVIIFLLLIFSIILDILWCLLRTKLPFKILANFTWCVFAPTAILIAILLNLMVPLSSSIAELQILIEPALMNQTFYSHVEYPDKNIRSKFHPCFFQNWDIYGAESLARPLTVLEQTQTAYQTGISLSSTTSSSITTNLTAVEQQLDSWAALTQPLLNEENRYNQDEVIQQITALTDRDNPYNKYGLVISQSTSGCPGAAVSDVWVWNEADCATKYPSYTKYAGSGAFVTKNCFWINSSSNYGKDNTIYDRYPTSCTVEIDGVTNNFRAWATIWLGYATDYKTDVETKINNLKSALTNLVNIEYSMTLNAFLAQMQILAQGSVKTGLDSDNTALEPIFSEFVTGDASFVKTRSCGFVKETLLGMVPQLAPLRSHFEIASLVFLGTILIISLVSLISCIYANFFKLVSKILMGEINEEKNIKKAEKKKLKDEKNREKMAAVQPGPPMSNTHDEMNPLKSGEVPIKKVNKKKSSQIAPAQDWKQGQAKPAPRFDAPPRTAPLNTMMMAQPIRPPKRRTNVPNEHGRKRIDEVKQSEIDEMQKRGLIGPAELGPLRPKRSDMKRL